MPSHRPERVSEAIREVVATAVLTEIADPRIQGVTVIRVGITPDLRYATVFVSIMGTESEQRQALKGLNSATGFLQSKVADRLQIRYTPILRFEVDQGVKKSVAMSKLVEEALASDRLAHPQNPDPAPVDSDTPSVDDH